MSIRNPDEYFGKELKVHDTADGSKSAVERLVMTTYKVSWKETIICGATVDANSPEDAIEKAKRGEYEGADSEPGERLMKSFRCDGVGTKQPDSSSLWANKRKA